MTMTPRPSKPPDVSAGGVSWALPDHFNASPSSTLLPRRIVSLEQPASPQERHSTRSSSTQPRRATALHRHTSARWRSQQSSLRAKEAVNAHCAVA
ncbi:uncharacterized protein CC84DRAFT_1166507 [Paraphaeosphaeria sporulosa]|uniref:Uncharacterized protein n=1 Tax=Paraphaeosphaeria sporulosa TaxID=1460663 RepID=A0A177C6A7_9PLEO|nr:uncharacterized protein CC84DRAFT_1166507 [Paraphaeosphaeria sporulosa]OAG02671.1 hypothetical protein CC84DRAFT_1166507 [Paraphaeosphaeria sporulosa]